jgi:hypothetical protein
VIPEATYYPQCAPQDLSGGYNGNGVELVFPNNAFYLLSTTFSSAYACCEYCVTSSACGTAVYGAQNGDCIVIDPSSSYSPTNILSTYNTGTGVAPGGIFIVINTACGENFLG